MARLDTGSGGSLSGKDPSEVYQRATHSTRSETRMRAPTFEIGVVIHRFLSQDLSLIPDSSSSAVIDSIFVKPKSFFPRSFREAPIR